MLIPHSGQILPIPQLGVGKGVAYTRGGGGYYQTQPRKFAITDITWLINTQFCRLRNSKFILLGTKNLPFANQMSWKIELITLGPCQYVLQNAFICSGSCISFPKWLIIQCMA